MLSLDAVPHFTGASVTLPPARSLYVVKFPFALPHISGRAASSDLLILAAEFSLYFYMFSRELVGLKLLVAGLSLSAP